MEDVDEKAEELVASWINGNRKDVMKTLGNMSGMRAACLSAIMCTTLRSDVAADFIRMMKRRLE